MATAARSVRQQQRKKKGQWRDGLQRRARRSTAFAWGGLLILLALLILAALVSYRPSDPSFNTAAAGPVRNWLGTPGAYVSDLLLSLWGPPAGLFLPLLALIGIRLARGAEPGRRVKAFIVTAIGITLIGLAAALLVGGAINGLPAGWGGAIGLTLGKLVETGLTAIGQPDIVEPARIVIVVLAALGGLLLCFLGLGLRSEERQWLQSLRQRELDEEEEDYEDAPPLPEERPARPPVIAPAEPHRTIIAERRPPTGAGPGTVTRR